MPVFAQATKKERRARFVAALYWNVMLRAEAVTEAPTRLDVAAVQTALAADGLDGWLLYDFRGLNPIATSGIVPRSPATSVRPRSCTGSRIRRLTRSPRESTVACERANTRSSSSSRVGSETRGW